MEVPESAHVWGFYSASRVHDPGPALAVQRVGRNDERGWWDGGHVGEESVGGRMCLFQGRVCVVG